ncbi:YhjD/YihY/BrkB family envelope integrity protein [Streptomyces misionensis]|uniref:YhjD/YihY/BrkB family envelope integrity protein n=1 Tax=Streptomyces misionensis TaxID=67331 RepID=UPI0036A2C394
MTVRRVVPTIHSQAAQESREFYGLLGFEEVMNHGWIMTLASPANPAAQISVTAGDKTAPVTPDMSVEVDDVDTAVGLCASTLLSVAASQTYLFGVRLRGGSWFAVTAGSVCLNTLLLLVSYRLLTHRALPLRRLAGVALGGACAWQALQWVGSYYVSHVLHGATATYGMFGIVLGLLAWLYVGALIFIMAAEAGAVWVMRLWPRSLLTPFTDRVQLSAADRRAYRSYAATEAFKGFQKISVRFDPPPEPQHREPPDDAR